MSKISTPNLQVLDISKINQHNMYDLNYTGTINNTKYKLCALEYALYGIMYAKYPDEYKEFRNQALHIIHKLGFDLTKRFGDEKLTLFGYAVKVFNDQEILEFIIEQSSQKNKADFVNQMVGEFGVSPILLAKNSQVINILVQYGASVNHINDKGDNALHNVFIRMPSYKYENIGNKSLKSVVKSLIRAGVETNVNNQAGVTPFDLAIKNKQILDNELKALFTIKAFETRNIKIVSKTLKEFGALVNPDNFISLVEKFISEELLENNIFTNIKDFLIAMEYANDENAQLIKGNILSVLLESVEDKVSSNKDETDEKEYLPPHPFIQSEEDVNLGSSLFLGDQFDFYRS